MNNYLKIKFPYLTDFFETALNGAKNKVANSIIFYGPNIAAQYYFALSLAKDLNCREHKTDECRCINCNWIKENKHPAVMTVSKIDNKNDNSKTVISKEQADTVKDMLVNSSDYHRVFIFCDADFKVLTPSEKQNIEEFGKLGFCLPHSPSEELSWYPKGLNKTCFQDVCANALLKSIEEPPENVTFVFLTENKDDLISTIVSRSQAFFVPGVNKVNYDSSFWRDNLSQYPDFDRSNTLRFSRLLFEYQEQQGFCVKEILNSLQSYLKEIIKNNTDNQLLCLKANKDIEQIQHYKKMSDAYIKEQIIYEDLAFYLAGMK